MTALQYILDGLQAELELARELGVRTMEVDRALLTVSQPQPAIRPLSQPQPQVKPLPRPAPNVQPPTRSPLRPSPSLQEYPFVFLHAGPLVPAGVVMIDKIVALLGYARGAIPVIVSLPLPTAKFYVVLGAKALKQFFPNVTGAPGCWRAGPSGEQFLITYSPHYFLRFSQNAPGIKRLKHGMLRDLKALVQRLQL